jgi:hypothetical protein
MEDADSNGAVEQHRYDFVNTKPVYFLNSMGAAGRELVTDSLDRYLRLAPAWVSRQTYITAFDFDEYPQPGCADTRAFVHTLRNQRGGERCVSAVALNTALPWSDEPANDGHWSEPPVVDRGIYGIDGLTVGDWAKRSALHEWMHVATEYLTDSQLDELDAIVRTVPRELLKNISQLAKRNVKEGDAREVAVEVLTAAFRSEPISTKHAGFSKALTWVYQLQFRPETVRLGRASSLLMLRSAQYPSSGTRRQSDGWRPDPRTLQSLDVKHYGETVRGWFEASGLGDFRQYIESRREAADFLDMATASWADVGLSTTLEEMLHEESALVGKPVVRSGWGVGNISRSLLERSRTRAPRPRDGGAPEGYEVGSMQPFLSDQARPTGIDGVDMPGL